MTIAVDWDVKQQNKQTKDAHKTNFITEATTMNADQSSLIWVHIVCNIGHQCTWAEERADDNFCE